MEFIYDGSHLGKKGKEPLFIYTNGLSLWIDFDMETGIQTCEVRLEDEVVKKFDKVVLGEAFIEGMKVYAEKQGEIFVPKSTLNLSEDVVLLQNQIRKITKEKEQAEKLASKLVKGVMKNKTNETEETIQKILNKHVKEL